MADNSRFNFCPKCGAISREGICTSCGYQNAEQRSNQGAQVTTGMLPDQSVQGTAGVPPNQGAQPPHQSGQGIPYQEVQPPNQNMQGTTGESPYQGMQGTTRESPFHGMQLPYQSGQYQEQPQYGVYMPTATTETLSKQSKRHMTIIFIVAAGIVLVAIAALLFLGMSIIRKSSRGSNLSASQDRIRQEDIMPDSDEDLITGMGEGILPFDDDSYLYLCNDVTRRNWEEEGQDESTPYYSGPYNALRDDLSYKVSFIEEFCYSKNDEDIYLSVEYPQLSGELKNIEYINAILAYEYEFIIGIYESDMEPYMVEDDICSMYVDSYVTYMDEKIFSVVLYESVYCEQGRYPYSFINFYCLNFDLETGTLLNNMELLRIDEKFALDFRHREVEENGDKILTAFTDQEILELLQSDYLLVAFYTPKGMEIGLNMDEVIIYVTYSDYEQYLNSF